MTTWISATIERRWKRESHLIAPGLPAKVRRLAEQSTGFEEHSINRSTARVPENLPVDVASQLEPHLQYHPHQVDGQIKAETISVRCLRNPADPRFTFYMIPRAEGFQVVTTMRTVTPFGAVLLAGALLIAAVTLIALAV